MFELNRDGTRAIMPINDMANICGYFFNAELDDSCETSPNNGYNCKHPECGEIQDDIGCCMCSSCPMGWEADEDDCDELLMEAIELAVNMGQVSASMIQRKFKVGYARAGRIVDQMEERGIISGYQGSKPREVLMTKDRWEELKMSTSPIADKPSINVEKTVDTIKKVAALNAESNTEENY